MIKFCPICRENHSTEWGCIAGYFWGLKDDINVCLVDNAQMTNINFPASDLRDLGYISKSASFIDAMINLYQTDIIEYELKMSQFRQQLEQQKQAKQDNQLRCPYCHSTDVKKITMTSKVTHGAVFGLFGARKILKQWHCNKCKSDF